MGKGKQRLDALLVTGGWCESRQQAQRLIRAGEVKVDDRVIDKPGTEVTLDAHVSIKTRPQFVSRGGEKLAKALDFFGLDVRDRVCLDGGISTGGFTDCLLQRGAAKVFGVDVGYGQVAWSLRQDARVILKERTNLRYLIASELYGDEEFADLGVIDVSFISLTKVLEAMWNLLQEPRDLITLVKPQFEVGKDRVGKKGVVRDPRDHAGAIAQVLDFARSLGWHYQGLTWSPITGPAGNVEYLLWLNLETGQEPEQVNLLNLTKNAVESLRS